jgi:hypothetical protein
MMLTALLLASVGLRGQTACPTVQDVADRLGGLDVDRTGELHWVELSDEPDALRLSLWSPDGSLEAVRVLPRGGSCDALARASAVTVATWAKQQQQAPQHVEVSYPAPPHVTHTVFDPDTLRAERARIAALPRPELESLEDAGPTRLRGPLIAMAVGLVAQMVLPVWLASSNGWDHGNWGYPVAFFIGGTLNVGVGLVWLLAALGAAPHDRAVAF